MKLNRKSVLSENKKIVNIKQQSGKHETYTTLDLYDEDGKLKAEFLPTVSIGGDYDRLPLDYAIQQLFLEVIKSSNFWTYFLKMWNEKLVYDSGGEVFTSNDGEVYWFGGD